MDTNETRDEVLEEEVKDETTNEETTTEEGTEEKADMKEGLFKKILRWSGAGIAAVVGFFKKLFHIGNKEDAPASETADADKKPGFFGKIINKVKSFLGGKANFAGGEDVIRSCGMSAMIAFRCATFVRKMIKKIGKLFGCKANDGDDEKKVSGLASVIHAIIKVLCVVGSVAFAAVVVYYFVLLLPSILVAVAKIMAVALIVELVFCMLSATTGEYVKE